MKFLKIALSATFFASVIASTANAGVYSQHHPESVSTFAPINCDNYDVQERFKCLALQQKPEIEEPTDKAKKKNESEQEIDFGDVKNNPLNMPEEQVHQGLSAPFAPDLDGQKADSLYARCFEWCCRWCRRP